MGCWWAARESLSEFGSGRRDKLRAVAKKLLLPTTTIRKSGLVTKTGIQDKARAEEFFDSLRGELGDELMEELEDNLRKQVALKQNDKVSDLSEDLMKNPAGIVSAILGDGGAVTGFDSGSAQTMANMASSIFKQGLGS